MSKTNEHHAAAEDESTKHFASDLEELKSSFGQLREDVSKLLNNAIGTGKSGAGMLRDHATSAAQDFRDCGAESVDCVEHTIGQRPLLSLAVAMGVGFVAANVLMRRR